MLELNTDCSLDTSSGVLTAGGVVHDHGGNWVGGFVVEVGCASVLEGELWGVFHGLRLCRRRGFRQITAETDLAEAIRLIESSGDTH